MVDYVTFITVVVAFSALFGIALGLATHTGERKEA
jgi:hypothetical protein